MNGAAAKRPSFAPRNWPGWFSVAAIWLLGRLPHRPTAATAEAIGVLLYRFANRRRLVAERNIERCFSSLSEIERKEIIKANFRFVGRMLVEMAWSWSTRDRLIDALGEVHGLEHLRSAEEKHRGVLVVTLHATCLEMGARIAALQVRASGIYRPLKNEVMEWYQNRCRARFCKSMLSKRNLRAGLRALKAGEVLWYAPDQDFGKKQSVFVDFFGIPAATLLATHRLPSLTGCEVVMMFPHFDRTTGKYHVEFSPAPENFPGQDPVVGLGMINALIEDWVRAHPEQYWWVHRRFKTRPDGQPPFYD